MKACAILVVKGYENMKRQKIRKIIILISFLLFPITIYYLSPYLIIQAGMEGAISGSFIMFAAMFVSSLFFGRAFCGWLCPAGGLQDCCSAASDKRVKGGRRNWIKYFLWVPWITGIVLAFASAGGIKSVDFLYYTDRGISVAEPRAYIIYYFFVALLAIMALVAGRRAGCHYLCWMAPFMIIGTKLKNRLGYPSLKLAADNGKCTGCKLCTRQCPMSLEVDKMVRDNVMNNDECILCGMCADSCTSRAIRYGFGSSHRNTGK